MAWPLACPICRSGVCLDDGRAICPVCGGVGALRRGVWDFVGARDAGSTGDYAQSFGDQWARFRHTQLDCRNGTAISRDRFARVTGWSRSDMEGAVVLDGGCGAGRYSDVALDLGARLVAMDLSDASFVARENLGPDREVLVVRGDVLNPPLAPGSFDKVFSIGVLQHTPDPLEAARRLLELVRPGGQLVLWMYERRWYSPLHPRRALRRVARRLGPRTVSGLSETLVRVFTPLARLIARVPGPRLQHGLRALLPIASYRGVLPLDEQQQVEWSLLDTHDWLAPTHDHPSTYADLRAVLIAAGASEVVRRPGPGLTIAATTRARV